MNHNNLLLEILHIISHDGFYSDKEALIDFLKKNGVSCYEINRHLKKD